MASSHSKTELFETMPIPRAVAQLSIPMVISSLVMVLYNLADTYFVGMLNDPVQNAAVTLVYPIMLAFNAVNNLFGVGTSSMMSRSLGAKQYEKTRTCSAFGFYGALFSCIGFSLVCILLRSPLLRLLGADGDTWQATENYFLYTVMLGAAPSILNVVQAQMVRSEGASIHASAGTMLGCLLNIVLDPIFILPWGFNMGAAGAGLATLISNCVACGYFFILAYVKRGNTFVCLDIRRLRHVNGSIVRGIMGVGIPASIQNLLNVTGSTILNNFTASYGPTAVAAMGVAQKINMIPLQISMGFGQGIMPLVSYTYANKDHKRMRGSIVFALSFIVPVMGVVCVGYWAGAEALIGAFMENPQIIEYGTAFLRAMCLGIVFLCTDFLAVGVFQALGLGRTALLFALIRKVILEIPLLILLNHFFGLMGLPYAQPITELVLAIASIFMLMRIFRQVERQSSN